MSTNAQFEAAKIAFLQVWNGATYEGIFDDALRAALAAAQAAGAGINEHDLLCRIRIDDSDPFNAGWNAAIEEIRALRSPSCLSAEALAKAGASEDKPAARPKKLQEQPNGWYLHDCGQWVHDELAPCTVCPPPSSSAPAGAPSEAARWKGALEAIANDPGDARNVARAALGHFD